MRSSWVVVLWLSSRWNISSKLMNSFVDFAYANMIFTIGGKHLGKMLATFLAQSCALWSTAIRICTHTFTNCSEFLQLYQWQQQVLNDHSQLWIASELMQGAQWEKKDFLVWVIWTLIEKLCQKFQSLKYWENLLVKKIEELSLEMFKICLSIICLGSFVVISYE